jgi:hypothetical protein
VLLLVVLLLLLLLLLAWLSSVRVLLCQSDNVAERKTINCGQGWLGHAYRSRSGSGSCQTADCLTNLDKLAALPGMGRHGTPGNVVCMFICVRILRELCLSGNDAATACDLSDHFDLPVSCAAEIPQPCISETHAATNSLTQIF